jgi:hypothetical protein
MSVGDKKKEFDKDVDDQGGDEMNGQQRDADVRRKPEINLSRLLRL